MLKTPLAKSRVELSGTCALACERLHGQKGLGDQHPCQLLERLDPGTEEAAADEGADPVDAAAGAVVAMGVAGAAGAAVVGIVGADAAAGKAFLE